MVIIVFAFAACRANNNADTVSKQVAPQPQSITESAAIQQPSATIGHQTAKDFLMSYVSLFGLGFYDDGNFFSWGDWEHSVILDCPPLVYVEFGYPTNWYSGTAFDRYRNMILDDVPFLRGKLIAHNFILYDFDGNGIPEIFIFYVAETWGSGVLYRLVDGSYYGIPIGWPPQFYSDEDGRTFMASYDYDWVNISYLTITTEGIEISNPISVDLDGYERWATLMTQIQPLADMHEYITASITQRLENNNITPAYLSQEEAVS